jgi:hypothetical protein
LCPKSRIDALCAAVESGSISTTGQQYEALQAVQATYAEDEWNWFLVNYQKVSGKGLADEGTEGLLSLLDRWREASLKLLNMVINDISKEFEGEVSTGFGIDGNRDADFEAVRGTFAGNKFVMRLNNEIEDVKKKYDSAKTLINSMKG